MNSKFNHALILCMLISASCTQKYFIYDETDLSINLITKQLNKRKSVFMYDSLKDKNVKYSIDSLKDSELYISRVRLFRKTSSMVVKSTDPSYIGDHKFKLTHKKQLQHGDPLKLKLKSSETTEPVRLVFMTDSTFLFQSRNGSQFAVGFSEIEHLTMLKSRKPRAIEIIEVVGVITGLWLLIELLLKIPDSPGLLPLTI